MANNKNIYLIILRTFRSSHVSQVPQFKNQTKLSQGSFPCSHQARKSLLGYTAVFVHKQGVGLT